ncbi:MAG: hypothetical protein KGM24_12285 [Elusimicrobia bacterium]|nr:hypothetical protein [Elusimicrobiota bacterium]
MHHFKKAIVKSFSLVVAVLERSALAAVATMLVAQALPFVADLKRYRLLENVFLIEQHLEKPATALLRANLPLVYGGVDLSPYLIIGALMILWGVCEAERGRLARMLHRIDADRREARAEMDAERKRRKMREEIERAEKAAAARAKEEARLRAEAEAKARAETEARARAEAKARAEEQKQAASPIPEPAPVPPALPGVEGTDREKLLELYAQTKKSLEEQKKNLSFLAVDVVDSTGMKHGEDASLAERDFRQYRKLVERVIAANKGLKAAWTPDGVMICFASVQNAVQAAQDLIRGLEHFNRQVKTIKADFRVRCGINAGRVMFDDSVRMEEMADRNIDIAGHMQKYADANTIYIGAHAIEGVRMQGFRPAQKKVDGCDVYEWRPDGSSEAQAAAA